MKTPKKLLPLLAMFLLFACGGSNIGTQVPSATGTDLLLKSSGGYQVVPLADIKSVTITVDAKPDTTETPLTRTFTGAELETLLGTLRFGSPSEPGFASALISGRVTLAIGSNKNEFRNFDILNQRMLVDQNFHEVYYRPQVTIDRAWLEKQ